MENLFVSVVSDVHICGACQSQFSLIASFVAHIKVCPKRLPPVSHRNGTADTAQSHPYPSQTPVLHIPEVEPEEENQRSEEISAPAASPSAEAATTAAENSDSPVYFTSNVSGLEINTGPSTNGSSVALPVQDVPPPAPTTSDLSSSSDASSKGVTRYKKISVMGITKYRCTYELCVFTTQYLKDVDRHYRIHTGEKPYHCRQCSKRFSRTDKLKIHQMAHKGEKPFKCLECSYATNDNSSLVKHRRVHTGERPYKCQICPYASRNASQLVVHLRTHTGDTPFHCRLCNMKFKVNSDLKRHIRLHTGEKPYACTFCGFRCSIKGNLNAHMKSHVTENPLRCEQCDFATPSRKDLRVHERLHQDRAYQCMQCSYTAGSQSALNVHTRIHSHEKPYQCQYCSYTSRQSCNLQTHIEKKHTDRQPNSTRARKKGSSKGRGQAKTAKPTCHKTFKCKVCKSEFVRIDSLRCHLRQHQAEMQSPNELDLHISQVRSKELSIIAESDEDQLTDSTDQLQSSTSESISLPVDHSSVPQEMELVENPPESTASNTFNNSNLNFTDTSQLGAAMGVNLVLTTTDPAVSTPSVQSELLDKRDLLKGILMKSAKEELGNVTMISNDVLSQGAMNMQAANTIITPTQATNDLGLFQFYQMPTNLGFVTLPLVPSASNQNAFSSNVVNSLGELDLTSLVNPSALLHLSGIGPNIQYVISQPSTKLNADS